MATKKRIKKTKLKKKVLPKPKKPSFLEGPLHKTKVRIVGIGGGGGSIVSEIASRLKRVSFVIANTDLRALRKSTRKAKRFSFGKDITQGLGTGMNADLGKIAAENEKERIKKILEGQDLCILVASLGGGTGSGAAPVFAKISKKLGNLTYGIFTLPFRFEGEKKMEIAKDSLKKLKPSLNALTIIPNERIFQIIDKKTPLKEALSQINKTLAQALEGLIETIYLPGLINIDFADLKTILQAKGKLTYLNTIEVRGTDRIEEAIKKTTSSPLYPYSIQGAKGILFNIAGEKDINLAEVSEISKRVFESVNKEAKIIFGISQSASWRKKEKIRITLLATGCKTKIFPSKPRKRKDLGIRKRLKKRLTQKPKTPLAQKEKIKLKPETKIKHPLPKKPSKPKIKIKVKFKKTISSRLSVKGKLKEKSKKKKSEKTQKPETKRGILPSPPTLKDISQTATSLEEALKTKARVRKTAIQIKKEFEQQEKEMLKKEKEWEIPTFFRKKAIKNK